MVQPLVADNPTRILRAILIAFCTSLAVVGAAAPDTWPRWGTI